MSYSISQSGAAGMSVPRESIPKMAIDAYKELIRWGSTNVRYCCLRVRSATGGIVESTVVSSNIVGDSGWASRAARVTLKSKLTCNTYTLQGTAQDGTIVLEDYALAVARLLGYKCGNFYTFSEEIRKSPIGERYFLVGIDGTESTMTGIFKSRKRT